MILFPNFEYARPGNRNARFNFPFRFAAPGSLELERHDGSGTADIRFVTKHQGTISTSDGQQYRISSESGTVSVDIDSTPITVYLKDAEGSVLQSIRLEPVEILPEVLLCLPEASEADQPILIAYNLVHRQLLRYAKMLITFPGGLPPEEHDLLQNTCGDVVISSPQGQVKFELVYAGGKFSTQMRRQTQSLTVGPSSSRKMQIGVIQQGAIGCDHHIQWHCIGYSNLTLYWGDAVVKLPELSGQCMLSYKFLPAEARITGITRDGNIEHRTVTINPWNN